MNEKRRRAAGGPTPLGGAAGVLPGGAERREKTVLGRRPTAAAAAAGSTVGLCGQQKTSGREARGGRARGARARGARGVQRGATSQAPSARAVLVCDTEGSWGRGTQNDAARGSPVSSLPGTPPPLRAATVPPPPAGPGEGPAPFRNEAARPAELGSGSGVWAPKACALPRGSPASRGGRLSVITLSVPEPHSVLADNHAELWGLVLMGEGRFCSPGDVGDVRRTWGWAGEGLLASAG